MATKYAHYPFKINNKLSSCMATNEIKNGCRFSIDGPSHENRKRRCVKKRLAVSRRLIDSLSSGVDGPVLCLTG